MFRFHFDFPERPAMFRMIDSATPRDAIAQARAAAADHAAGIIMRNSSCDAVALEDAYEAVRAVYPEWWIGLSYTDCSGVEACRRIPEKASGVWVGDVTGGIRDPKRAADYAHQLSHAHRARRPEAMLFAGVSFHPGSSMEAIVRHARTAMLAADVIGVRWSVDSHVQSLDRLKAIRDAIGNYPIVIDNFPFSGGEDIAALADGMIASAPARSTEQPLLLPPRRGSREMAVAQ